MSEPTDAHWMGAQSAVLRARRGGAARVTSRSVYVPMRDGARIALDVHLPRDASGPVPAIIRQTRYIRSLDVGPVFARLGLPRRFDLYSDMRREFIHAGYAWVDVDVRGTGASTGAWRAPWYADEVRDGGEIASWICAQPWSSGKIGALGISYDGTSAEMLLVNRHPAVLAVAPLFSLYDVFTDVAFPGGAGLAWFTEAWARYNAALDRGAFAEAMTIPMWLMARAALASPRPRGADRVFARLALLGEDRFTRTMAHLLVRALRGVRDVERLGDGAPDAARLAERAANLDVHAGARALRFRDDTGVHPTLHELTVDAFSPHAHRDAIAGSGAAIYSYSGWRDGAYPHAAIKRHLSIPRAGSRLTIGPWAHTGRLRVHAGALGAPTRFDHTSELVDFFDAHLKGAHTAGDGQPVHYFTMGEERWKSAPAWPPPAAREVALHLASERRLASTPDARGGADAYGGERGGTGERSRWRSLLSLVPGDYPDRRERDRHLLVYDGAPLVRDLEVTGHPRVTLYASWDDDGDGELFAYLEEVRPDGEVTYVTEGQLRALHRARGVAPYASPAPPRSFRRADARPVAASEIAELTFDLLPVSYRFKRGRRVRLALAPCDVDHFAPPRATRLRVHRGASHPSTLWLPVMD